MPPIIPRSFTAYDGAAAVVVALVVVLVSSRLMPGTRRSVHAIGVAGAGAAYLTAGLGPWEFVFTAAATVVAWRALTDVRWIGVAWVMHAGWDVVHHLYAAPIVWAVPSSSAQCAVCDLVLAAWFLVGAPGVAGCPDPPPDVRNHGELPDSAYAQGPRSYPPAP